MVLTFVDRIHNVPYLQTPTEPNISSPKSVNFSEDGKKVYINSLEGFQTLIFDADSRERIGIISHDFDTDKGKPVEGAFSNSGKFLWIPYYRWQSDTYGNYASSVAIVDTIKQKVVKLFETGLISKNIAISPMNNFAAVTNWGENTVTLLNIKGDNPSDFSYNSTLVIKNKFSLFSDKPVNHDLNCDLCARGVLFSPDEKTLLVGMSGENGIAGFDIPTKKFLGIIAGKNILARDLTLSPNKKDLYISSNGGGTIERVKLSNLISALYATYGKTISRPELFDEVVVGGLPRTLKLTSDGKYAFVALNSSAEVVAIDTVTFKIVARIKGDSFLVGLDISPDNKWIWTTSQGHAGVGGGNAVDIFSVEYK